MSGHRSSLAHVPVGQRLRDVESLPNVWVVEVGGRGRGVGAGRIQAYLFPRTQQQCLGAWTQGRGERAFNSLTSPLPPGTAHTLAYLRKSLLEWQASEDVAKILDHKCVLISVRNRQTNG